ncbi:DUF4165 domain-containing protein [Escherichia coli]
MRKTLIGCMVATALATVSSAHAQVFSYSFTDTNKAVRNIKPATQTYLNPAGVLTLNLISGLDWYERVTVTRDSDKKGYVFLRHSKRALQIVSLLPMEQNTMERIWFYRRSEKGPLL